MLRRRLRRKREKDGALLRERGERTQKDRHPRTEAPRSTRRSRRFSRRLRIRRVTGSDLRMSARCLARRAAPSLDCANRPGAEVRWFDVVRKRNAVLFRPSDQRVQRPRTAPAHSSFPILKRGPYPPGRSRVESNLRGARGCKAAVNFGEELIPHPALEWKREATLRALLERRRKEVLHRLEKYRLGYAATKLH